MTDKMPKDVSFQGCDVRAITDALRAEYPLVKTTAEEWVLLTHADVKAAALADVQFSSNVSRFLQIPNGLDGQTHSKYRAVIDSYLTPAALTPYKPVFKHVAEQLVSELPRGKVLDAVADIGAVFAVRAQCAWLGWPTDLESKLLAWMKDNHLATRSGNIEKTAKVAAKFDAIVQSIIEPRRSFSTDSTDDITSKLCHETVNGKQLTDDEIVSILRNWTGGDLGSIALCVGVIIAYLIEHPTLIDQIKAGTDYEVEAIIDEILRIDNPFVANRRITTCPLSIAGQDLPEGTRVKLNWTSANRDESVFNNNQFDPKANADNNLVYGIGKHVCPGRMLASWELRIALQALLSSVTDISLSPEHLPEREVAPLGGYHKVPVILT